MLRNEYPSFGGRVYCPVDYAHQNKNTQGGSDSKFKYLRLSLYVSTYFTIIVGMSKRCPWLILFVVYSLMNLLSENGINFNYCITYIGENARDNTHYYVCYNVVLQTLALVVVYLFLKLLTYDVNDVAMAILSLAPLWAPFVYVLHAVGCKG